jgi:transcriptional regulator with XRE-family HTH domain/quercetin dioxygenase-like cupin family protein
MPSLGLRVRNARLRTGFSLRGLAREAGISASMLSQIETGKSSPSVSTLYAITAALGISIQDVFDVAEQSEEEAKAVAAPESGDAASAASSSASATPATLLQTLGFSRGRRIGPHVTPADRQALTLDTGVCWERLGELPPHPVDFLLVTYPPGGTSSSTGGLMRHPGSEYGFLVSGELLLTLGFEEILLRAGDAISFESTTPHSYRNVSEEPAVGVWFVMEQGR